MKSVDFNELACEPQGRGHIKKTALGVTDNGYYNGGEDNFLSDHQRKLHDYYPLRHRSFFMEKS
jgi:hypothetical protein